MARPEEILASISYLLYAFPNFAPQGGTIEAYVTDLADLPAGPLHHAAQILRRSSRYFPTIGEWRQTTERLLIDQARAYEQAAQARALLTLEAENGPPSEEAKARVRALIADLFPTLPNDDRTE